VILRRLSWRIAAVSAAASAAALLAVLLLVGPGLRARAQADLADRLRAEARLVARLVEEPMARGAESAELDRMVDATARDVRMRVTVVDPTGRVVADSSLSGAALAHVENHGDRAEIRTALQAGTGSAQRHSTTIDQDLLYTAVSIRSQGRLLGAARVALSLDAVEQQVASLRRAVAVALGLAFLITAVLSALLAAPLAGPLRDMMEAARRFGTGDLTTRIPVRRTDELGELAGLLNHALAQLQSRFAEGARDRARMQAILAAMDDGVMAVDHDGRVVLANDSLRRLTGGSDPVGRPYVEVLRQRAVGDVVERVLRTGRRAVLDDVGLRPAGRLYAVGAVAFPGVEGAPQGAVVTFHDVTERRRLERIRRDFVANASHELRTPLTSIRGFVEALQDGAVADPQTGPRFLDKIRVHADRMANLVDDLLELSRIESGESPPLREEVVLPEIVEEVVSSLAESARRKAIELGWRDEGAAPLHSDGERVRRILLNLVDNAVKYTPEGGHVQVRVAAMDGGGALVEVQDDGPGIAPEHLPRLFERFYRVDKARSREIGGTGLGLAIVRHLAEGMGASVSVSSEVGRGTRFTLRLPPAPAGGA
jgi:two-component system phosphate regulon sensor histidine kinase PhoR